MQELQHLVNLEKRKISLVFIYLFLFHIGFCNACKFYSGFISLRSLGSCTATMLNDSTYESSVLIDNIVIKVKYTDVGDTSIINIKITNTGKDAIWVGTNSINFQVKNGNVTETVLPDINLEENINLVSINNNDTMTISENRFKEFNSYAFSFYIINNLDEFIKSAKSIYPIKNFYNDKNETLIEISHNKVPDKGMTIITIKDISFVNKVNAVSYVITKY